MNQDAMNQDRRLRLKLYRFVLALLLLTSSASFGQQPNSASYLDPNLPPERRAAEIVLRMTLEEKVLQMQSTAPAIPRLGVAAYNWWNEALHGVVQGRATVFRRPLDSPRHGIRSDVSGWLTSSLPKHGRSTTTLWSSR